MMMGDRDFDDIATMLMLPLLMVAVLTLGAKYADDIMVHASDALAAAWDYVQGVWTQMKGAVK